MIQLIRGFRDILPGEVELWQHIEKTASALFESFGFKEIRIPLLERAELFARSIGEDTDIVEKEMYTFPDRKGDLITLRPEATASIVRAYIQHKIYAQDPLQKYFMVGPMFRRERPQKGRYRQFYQIDAEIFGDASPYADAQLIFLLDRLCRELSVKDVTAHINSLGCPACRPQFRSVLTSFLDSAAERLCEDCRRRRKRNPLRVLDCKVPSCRDAVADAPSILSHLCEDCRTHFDALKTALQGLSIPFQVDSRLVRGLDYYTRTAFEIQTGSLGAQSAVAGGGRYDGLIHALGGPALPATGFAVGFDRLAEIAASDAPHLLRGPHLYIAALGAAGIARAFEWCCRLGEQGVVAETDFSGRSLKSQMKRADRLGARFVLIVGDNELQQGAAVLRDMQTHEQFSIGLADLAADVKNRVLSAASDSNFIPERS